MAAPAFTVKRGLVAGYLLAAAVIAAAPLFLDAYWLDVLNSVGLYVLLALSLILILGDAGLFNMGHAAFYAMGAYTTAIVMAKSGLPYLVGIPMAGATAFVAGLVLGIPALRLRGHYLALVTLGITIATPQLIKRFDGLTGGTQGLSAGTITPPSWLGLAQDQYIYMIALVVTALALVMSANLVSSDSTRHQ